MTTAPSEPKELRGEVQQFVELNQGEIVGEIELNSELNLNALAIGLGLENLRYEPEAFPGLIYNHEGPEDVTLILFNNGRIAAVDATDPETAENAILKTTERIRDLGLYMDDQPDADEIKIQQD